jgi:hypothetical protein
LSEKDILIDGLLFIPYKACVELKLIELTERVTTSNVVGTGGGGGG